MTGPRAVVVAALVVTAFLVTGRAAVAQSVSQRGFVEGTGFFFPERAPNDSVRGVADLLAREELFVKPAPWIQLAAGIDLRANSHDQVEDEWRLDFTDRGTRRPRASMRRLSATLTYRRLTVDAGKQFIRWGKTDIVTPTDHFAPRDFLNVISADFLAVTGVRAVLQHGDDAFEGVWVPRFTPSRVPLVDQRWTAVPPTVQAPLVDRGGVFPDGSQIGVRWSRAGVVEFALSFFDGYNHLPTIDATFIPVAPQPAIGVTRLYPAIRSYGGDFAAPTPWFTIKAEAAVITSRASARAPAGDDYVLYVLQLERQSGEWVFIGGYAGEAVTARRTVSTFAPDRGMTKSIVGRAAYTIDPRRGVAFEGAVRQNGAGAYAKAEYYETRGQHWRVTVTAIGIGGDDDDFLGQYHDNSHLAIALRYSF